MKIGVIDVGGGLRGSYTAGVYDWCHDNDIRFDYCVGVSAGSANLSSYLAGQRGRNLKFYTEYNLREESMGLKNFIKDRNFVDLEYVYGELSNSYGEYPLDYNAMMANPAEFTIVATDAETGMPFHQRGYTKGRNGTDQSVKLCACRESAVSCQWTQIL